MSTPDPITVCILDDNPSTAGTRSGLLKSAGCKVRPFDRPETFLKYARDHHPAAAIVDWGRSHAQGLEIRARLREVSPMTSVIISTKIHETRARSMLSGEKLVGMIQRICTGRPLPDLTAESRRLFPKWGA